MDGALNIQPEEMDCIPCGSGDKLCEAGITSRNTGKDTLKEKSGEISSVTKMNNKNTEYNGNTDEQVYGLLCMECDSDDAVNDEEEEFVSNFKDDSEDCCEDELELEESTSDCKDDGGCENQAKSICNKVEKYCTENVDNDKHGNESKGATVDSDPEQQLDSEDTENVKKLEDGLETKQVHHEDISSLSGGDEQYDHTRGTSKKNVLPVKGVILFADQFKCKTSDTDDFANMELGGVRHSEDNTAVAMDEDSKAIISHKVEAIITTPAKEDSSTDSCNGDFYKNKLRHKRSSRCEKCKECLRKNCGRCKFCKDMKMFGGDDSLKKPCIRRRCVNKRYKVLL